MASLPAGGGASVSWESSFVWPDHDRLHDQLVKPVSVENTLAGRDPVNMETPIRQTTVVSSGCVTCHFDLVDRY